MSSDHARTMYKCVQDYNVSVLFCSANFGIHNFDHAHKKCPSRFNISITFMHQKLLISQYLRYM